MDQVDMNSLNAEYALETVSQIVRFVNERNLEFTKEVGKPNAMEEKLGKWFLKVQRGLEKAVKECKAAGI